MDENDSDIPIIVAARNGHNNIVNFLCNTGAELEAVNKKGETALTVASARNHCDVIQTLLDNGCDLDKKASNGLDALAMACKYGHISAVRLLVEAGAEIESECLNSKKTPAMVAVEYGNINILKCLVQQFGANINECHTDCGESTLHLACKFGHTDIVEFLLANGAKVNAIANDGSSALHFAVENGKIEIVEMLLKKRPKLQVKDCQGKPKSTKCDNFFFFYFNF